MKEKLLSLQSCGESVEKAISIHYSSLYTNEKFYSNYDTIILYGHNLPKKNKKINVHGTVGFYSQYLSDVEYIPYCSKSYIVDNADSILQKLCIRGTITERNWNVLKNDKNVYWEFIRNIPFEYLYPDYYVKLVSNSCQILAIGELKSLYLEDAWPQVMFGINEDFFRYSIYALETNGCVGKYTTDGANYDELVRNLPRRASLSGNSAVLLRAIGYRIGDKTVVGYRQHRRSIRPNRDYELNRLLSSHSSIIEPSNETLSRWFDMNSNAASEEEKTNYVYGKVFRSFIVENYRLLGL